MRRVGFERIVNCKEIKSTDASETEEVVETGDVEGAVGIPQTK